MSLTNTNREAGRQMRHGGLRDLRFAGTVAAGLVAGVLGVGALSAPLLGWNDWPDQLQPGADSSITMKSPEQRQAIAQPPRSGSRGPSSPTDIPGVGTVTAVVIAPTTGGPVTGATPVGGAGNGATVVRTSGRVGSSAQDGGSGTNFGGSGFVAPTNTADGNGNGLPDAWENAYGGNLDPNADDDADGLTNVEEFYLLTSPLRG